MRKLMMGAALAAVIATGAAADRYNGATKVTRGDYIGAEKDIVAERAAQGDSVDLLLNLAALYASTGRATQAHALYQQVAAAPDEQVQLRNGAWASSRALAARGIALTPMTVAAR